MYVPRINPLSSKTLAEEIAIARFIGGRLPYDVYIDLIRHGVIGKKRIVAHQHDVQPKGGIALEGSKKILELDDRRKRKSHVTP